MLQVLDTFSLTIMVTVLMPLGISAILSAISIVNYNSMIKHFGDHSQLTITGAGTVLHELAHAFIEILFIHHITSLNLLNVKGFGHNSSFLGYNTFDWNKKNWYADAGNFLIGLAPCLCYSFIIWILHGMMFSGQDAIDYGNGSFNGLIRATKNNIMNSFGPLSWRLVIFLFLIVITASACYDVSDLDFKVSFKGIYYWIMAITATFAVFLFADIIGIVPGAVVSWSDAMWKLAILMMMFLGRGIVYLITSWAILKLVSIF